MESLLEKIRYNVTVGISLLRKKNKNMKTAVVGSKTVTDFQIIKDMIMKPITLLNWKITEIVIGGVDYCDLGAALWARQNKVPIRIFSPNWKQWGRRAGFMRNIEMVNHADAIIILCEEDKDVFHNLINLAKEKRKQIFFYHLKEKYHENL